MDNLVISMKLVSIAVFWAITSSNFNMFEKDSTCYNFQTFKATFYSGTISMGNDAHSHAAKNSKALCVLPNASFGILWVSQLLILYSFMSMFHLLLSTLTSQQLCYLSVHYYLLYRELMTVLLLSIRSWSTSLSCKQHWGCGPFYSDFWKKILKNRGPFVPPRGGI